ncbi:MAG TPA: hypothetical protein VFQ80_08030, partial [Thermomicrobiales bacterium]|nr:hypothetical protein [Thermomicrobiales bacterium]
MSAADRRPLPDAVGEYWDAFVRGLPAPAASILDPVDVETIRRVAALDDARAPDPAFVRRLERDLMHMPAVRPDPFGLNLQTLVQSNGHMAPAPLPSAPRARRDRQWPAALAMAALLVLTLASGYLALLRPPRFDNRDRPPGIPALIGTPGASPAADAGFSSQSLLDIVVPAGTLAQPTTGTDIWLFSHYVVKAGDRVAYPDDCAAPDFVVRYVLAGVYTVRPTGPLEVIRNAAAGANATRETVAAGQMATLRAGDALVYRNTTNDRFAGFSNPGPGQLDLLEWEWLDNDCLGSIPPGLDLQWDEWTRWDASTQSNLFFDPTRAFTLRFRRMTAAPGATLPQNGPDGPGFLPPGMPGLEVGAAEAGNVRVENNLPNPNVLSPASTFYPRGGMVAGSSQLPVGTARAIRSAGDRPLLLYVLTVMNADANGRSVAATPNATPAASLPPGVTADTVLFDQRLYAIPADASWAGVERTTLGPGAGMHQGSPDSSGVGPMLYRVEAGTVTGQADGPVSVTRASAATAEQAAPGTDIELAAGDVVFVPAGVASQWRNSGGAPATILDAGISTVGVNGPDWADGPVLSYQALID